MSPNGLVALFLDMMAAERGVARNTLAAYGRDLEDYVAHLGAARVGPAEADAAVVRAYLARLETRGLKSSSAARRLSAVRQFHKFLYLEGYAGTDPTAPIAGPKRGRALPKVLSVDEVDCLLTVARETADGPTRSPFEQLR